MLAMLLGCGLRRSELVGLDTDEVQMRQGHWAIVDLIGRGGHIRTVPIPQWAKQALDLWTSAAGVTKGKIFRAVTKRGEAVCFRFNRKRGVPPGEALWAVSSRHQLRDPLSCPSAARQVGSPGWILSAASNS